VQRAGDPADVEWHAIEVQMRELPDEALHMADDLEAA
jgi:hypothetical protein